MKIRIMTLWQRLMTMANTVRHRIDEFWRKEDELYWVDPPAYLKRTDKFWTKLSLVLIALLFLMVWLGV